MRVFKVEFLVRIRCFSCKPRGAVSTSPATKVGETRVDGSGSEARAAAANLKNDEPTLDTALSDYLASKPDLRARTRNAYRKTLSRHLKDWLGLSLSAITSSMIEKRHMDIGIKGVTGKPSKTQANMTMRVARLIFNFARIRYKTVKGNPVLSTNPVDILTQNKSWFRTAAKQGIIPDSKLRKWFLAVNSVKSTCTRDYLLFLLLTGLRKSEAASMVWDDIDFDARTLSIDGERTKNHAQHTLPLSRFLIRLLKRRQSESQSIFIFPGRKAGISHVDQTLQVLRQQVDCYFTLHDLRRTFLTMAERQGIPHYALKRLANHSVKSDTTFGYIVMDVERLRQPMEKITNAFLNLMNHEEAPKNTPKGRPKAEISK